uniref:Lipocln_cytosolic_FA-bd_dom domain-containing protein n=2 Tax=Rhodnius prolixus TaxID=13249 RepID=T1IGK6_RHOPR
MFFAGRWYKQLGFGSLFQDIIGICPTVEYKITDDGEIKSLDYLYNQILQVYVFKSGNSYTRYIHDNLGYLSFTFNLGQGLLRETYPMYIIDTDYDDFAIVYYCRSFLFFMKTEAAWVMSRSRNEASPDQPAIIDALKRSGLDYSLFKPEVNTGCGLNEPNL